MATGWRGKGRQRRGVQEETRLPVGSVASVDRVADRALSWRWKWGETGRFRRLRRKNVERWRKRCERGN